MEGINFRSTDVANTYLETDLVRGIHTGMSDESIKFLIEKGADVNAVDKFGNIPLVFAITKDRSDELIKFLIEKGADVNAVDKFGNIPLVVAIKEDRSDESIKFLIEKGADVNAVDKLGNIPLVFAIKKDRSDELIEFLIKKGANVNAVDKLGNIPLVFAIKKDRSDELIEFLIKKGANVNVVDKSGNIPLVVAIKEDRSDELIKFLIEKGANVNVVDKFRNIPLVFAIKKDRSDELIEFLIKKGANLNLVHGIRNLLLILINRKISDQLIILLMERGADVDIADYSQEMSVPLVDMTNTPIVKKWIAINFLQNSNLERDAELRQALWEKCTKEIEILSKEIFQRGSDTISLKDIIKEANEKRLALISTNKEIVNEVQNVSFKEKYPVFAPIIQFKLEKGIETRKREDLVNSLTAIILHEESLLPPEIVKKIVNYLSTEDLLFCKRKEPTQWMHLLERAIKRD